MGDTKRVGFLIGFPNDQLEKYSKNKNGETLMRLGEVQELTIVKTTDNGVYLSDNETQHGRATFDLPIDRVLLPKNQTPKNAKIGDTIRVFLYKDSEDRPIATTTIPPLTLGKLAVLPVKEVSKIGAFLSWGLAKDLLLPFKEQTAKVKQGDSVLVALYIDKSGRLCATTKIYNYLQTDSDYKVGDKVFGTVYEIIDTFGAYVAVDNKFSGMIPKNELFTRPHIGDYIEARISVVHEDGKLALSLREPAHIQLSEDAEAVYEQLMEAGGFLPYHDKTDAEVIKDEFSLSKNAFKRAIGHLMKEGKITISDVGIKATGVDTSNAVPRK